MTNARTRASAVRLADLLRLLDRRVDVLGLRRAHALDGNRMRALASEGDMVAIGRFAHDLKTLAGNVFATEAQQLAMRTMDSARTKDPETSRHANDLADALDRMFDALRRGRPA